MLPKSAVDSFVKELPDGEKGKIMEQMKSAELQTERGVTTISDRVLKQVFGVLGPIQADARLHQLQRQAVLLRPEHLDELRQKKHGRR